MTLHLAVDNGRAPKGARYPYIMPARDMKSGAAGMLCVAASTARGAVNAAFERGCLPLAWPRVAPFELRETLR